MSGLHYGAESVRYTRDNVHVRYQEYSHREERRGACPVCGKRRSRARTITGTTSPFNKDPETGQPRTPQQVVDNLRTVGALWVPDFSCSTHEPAEVCAVVGHQPPHTFSPGKCGYCRAEVSS